jgi:hypothetical protein
MTPKQVKDIFDKLPSKRRKVLIGFLAGHSREKIMIDAGVPSNDALTGHLKELYKNFRIVTGWNDADDPRSGARKLPLLIALFAKYMPELTSDHIPDVLDDVEQEKAIAKPHRESGEAVDTFPASNLNAEQYNTLEKLLKAGKWQEADEETNNVMVKLAGREKEGWLDSAHIEKFPCSDLRSIDTLWVKYSKEQFGFSVQTRIWQDVGKPYEPDGVIYDRFCECVGWGKKLVVGNNVVEGIVDYLSYCDLIFNLNAPIGHLPSGIILGLKWRSFGDLGFWGGSAVIFSRVQACGL